MTRLTRRDKPRVDARTERWREHRIRVRADFVDAAVKAIAQYGPEVSMDDIARTAGAAKPKLYRHFENKLDLYSAIVARVQSILWERIVDNLDLASTPAGTIVRRGAAEYARIVHENPNLFRFLVHGHFTQQADESRRALAAAHESARTFATVLTAALDNPVVDGVRTELVTISIFGAVASATEWWVGPTDATARTLTVDEFATYLSALVFGIADSTSALAGVEFDHDLPLYLAVTARSHRQDAR